MINVLYLKKEIISQTIGMPMGLPRIGWHAVRIETFCKKLTDRSCRSGEEEDIAFHLSWEVLSS